MARTEARIKTAIWRDEDWLALDPPSKLTYVTILSQPTLSLCGVLAHTPGSWAHATGYKASQIRSAVAALIKARFIVADDRTEEVWVRSFIKNDGVTEKPYMAIAMAKDVAAVRSELIRGQIFDALGHGFITELPTRFPKAFAGPDAKRLPDSFEELFTDWFARGIAV